MLFICCASLCLFAVEMLMLVTSSFHDLERDWLHCASYTEDTFLKQVLWPLEHFFSEYKENLSFLCMNIPAVEILNTE